MVGELSVREDHTPHHFCQDHLLADVESVVDQSSELEVVDGRAPRIGGQHQQFPGGRGVKAKVTSERILDPRALDVAELAIGVSEFEQEGAGCDANQVRVFTPDVRLRLLC